MSADIRATILQRAADLAGVDVAEVSGESSLEALGLDSADAVILAMEIEEATGREIDVGIFLRFEKLDEAAAEIVKLLAQ